MPDKQLSELASSPGNRISKTILTAITLAGLMVLTGWGFELRSLRSLAIQSTVLAVCLALPIYGLVFRKSDPVFPPSSGFWMAGIVLSLAFSLLVVPSQSIDLRYFLTLALAFTACLVLNLVFLLPFFTQHIEVPAHSLTLLTLLGGVTGMTILLYNSLSARMYGDDFCYAVVRESKGFIQSVIWFYNHWSGRFFSNFLLMGFNDKPWIIAAQLAGISTACFLSIRSLICGGKGQRLMTALAVAVWAPFTIFIITPDMYKSVYWIVSSVAVLPVLILAPLYLALLWRFRDPKTNGLQWAVPLAALLSFAIAATHEAAVLGWLSLQLIGIVFFWFTSRENRALLIVLGCGFLAAAAALAVELLSPGIDARAAAQDYPPAGSPVVLIQLTFQFFMEFIRSIPTFGWLAIITTIGLGWSVETPLPRRPVYAAAILVISAGMTLACFVPGAYAMSSSIPLRTQVIPSAYLVYGIIAAALLLPRPSGRLWVTGSFVLALLITPIATLQSLQHIIPTIQPMRQFAQDWDDRDNRARLNDAEIQRIPIPWDEQEQEFNCTQNYYRSH